MTFLGRLVVAVALLVGKQSGAQTLDGQGACDTLLRNVVRWSEQFGEDKSSYHRLRAQLLLVDDSLAARLMRQQMGMSFTDSIAADPSRAMIEVGRYAKLGLAALERERIEGKKLHAAGKTKLFAEVSRGLAVEERMLTLLLEASAERQSDYSVDLGGSSRRHRLDLLLQKLDVLQIEVQPRCSN